MKSPLAALLLALFLAPLLQAEQPPNILFIIADDASRDSMGVYGSTYVETPNFDRIAREGRVVYTGLQLQSEMRSGSRLPGDR